MPRPTVTFDLSPEVYAQLQQRAQLHRRRREDEAGSALADALATSAPMPSDIEVVLDALATLDNDTLSRLSHSQPTVEDGLLLTTLIDKRSRIGLTPTEEQ